MKKSLFIVAAASALMLTACSSENDVLQSATEKQTAVQEQAVGFDVYMPEAVTRAGLPEGVMTTEKLKTTGEGFGVFAFFHDASKPETGYASGLKPNFMFNEHVSWVGGWTYSPLKYWPNETDNDSQDPAAYVPSDRIDKLSFFAYAPYVSETSKLSTKDNTTISIDGGSTKISAYHASETNGISAISSEVYDKDPVVEWKASKDPDHNVDLLWGVAPAGLSYTAVNGATSSAKVGMPILNMVKPDKDQKIKFLFQHALSRIGFSVVSAIDQIAAGDDGNKFDKAQTRVLIDDVTVWGDFGIQGALNLNNTESNRANWINASVVRTASTEAEPQFTINTTNKRLALDLRYDDTLIGNIESKSKKFEDLNNGVLPSEQVLMAGDADPSKKVSESATSPVFAWGNTYYYLSSGDYLLANVTYSNSEDLYTKDGENYVQAYKASETSVKLDGKSEKLYTLVIGAAVTSGGSLTANNEYYHKTTDADNYNVFTLIKATGSETVGADEYYPKANITNDIITGIPAYDSRIYWTGLLPRYFMVVPSAWPYVKGTTETTINVKIAYHVVTKDSKLEKTITNVENVITKQTKLQLESGKSYNLKLILGLTSVKLDATVADWQVADDAEIWLPKNNE